jgi:hypothetical protein
MNRGWSLFSAGTSIFYNYACDSHFGMIFFFFFRKRRKELWLMRWWQSLQVHAGTNASRVHLGAN